MQRKRVQEGRSKRRSKRTRNRRSKVDTELQRVFKELKNLLKLLAYKLLRGLHYKLGSSYFPDFSLMFVHI